jgi:hypothetical protein
VRRGLPFCLVATFSGGCIFWYWKYSWRNTNSRNSFDRGKESLHMQCACKKIMRQTRLHYEACVEQRTIHSFSHVFLNTKRLASWHLEKSSHRHVTYFPSCLLCHSKSQLSSPKYNSSESQLPSDLESPDSESPWSSHLLWIVKASIIMCESS